MADPIATVSARHLAMVAPFQSTEVTRYYLNGVYIAPHPDGGAVLVATDGHCMGVAHDPDGVVTEPGIWPISRMIATAARNKKAKTASFDGEVVKLSDEDGPFFAGLSRRVTGDFPDWRRVVTPVLAQEGSTPRFAVNPKYIERFGKIGWGITLFVRDPHSPISVLVEGEPSFHGIIMPMRGSWESASAQTWLTTLLPAPTAQAAE